MEQNQKSYQITTNSKVDSKLNNSDNYDQKYMKIIFNSDEKNAIHLYIENGC